MHDVIDPTCAADPRPQSIRHVIDEDSWAPLEGFQPDEVVIDKLKALIEDVMGGDASDLAEDFPLPEDGGAVVAFLQRQDTGSAVALVMVKPDLPTDLRADLWGFCAALAAGNIEALWAGGADVIVVGQHRRPLEGPGIAALGSAMARHVGRNSVGCSFDTWAARTDDLDNLVPIP